MADFVALQDKTVPTNGTVDIPVTVAAGYPECMVQAYRLVGATNPVVLAGNVTIAALGTPTLNQRVTFYNEAVYTLGVAGITVMGATMPTSFATKKWIASFIWDGTTWQGGFNGYFNEDGWIQGSDIEAGTIALTKLVNLTSAQIIVGNGSNIPAAVAMSGVIAISNSGVTSHVAGSIVNADINAAAAIAVSKLAALTASQVVVTTAGGVLTTSARLSATLGGTAIDSSASTGVVTVSAGSWAVGARTEVLQLMVSFEAAGGTVPSVGDFKVTMPFDGTVTSIYAYATKAIAATDNATIVPKNNAGTTMTGGTVTFTASDARGTAYTTTPTANNTFSTGDVLTFTTAKATAGGYAQLSITYTRLT